MISESAPTAEHVARFPSKMRVLAEPAPYKVLWGGRDSAKSWSIAQQCVIDASQRTIRILCCREIQKSLDESVHRLIKDTIYRLGLQDQFTILESSILGNFVDVHGKRSEFLFSGIKNAKNIKSYEDCDRAWVEEAQTVSKASREILLPTIRKEGSEIWISFNPELATDDCYRYWVLNPPPGAIVVKVGYQDNPWLSETSRAKIEHLRVTDPKTFEHVYGGECVNSLEGAIFGNEMKVARAEGRITQVPYNRARPVVTIWDLGYNDTNTIWFLQAYDGWYNFIDYEQGNGLTIADYIVRLQHKGYVYDVDWLPHDGIDTIIHKKLSGGSALSIEQLMRQAGRKPRIVPKTLITSQINAARTIFPMCRFDEEKCADGLQALSHYQWPPLTDPSEITLPSGVKVNEESKARKPLHNWASHGSSAFQGAAVAVKQPKEDRAVPPPPRAPANVHSWMG